MERRNSPRTVPLSHPIFRGQRYEEELGEAEKEGLEKSKENQESMFLKIKEGGLWSVLETGFSSVEATGHLDMSVAVTPDWKQVSERIGDHKYRHEEFYCKGGQNWIGVKCDISS